MDKTIYGVIKEALEYARENINNCSQHPSYQFKLDRLEEVKRALEWLKQQKEK